MHWLGWMGWLVIVAGCGDDDVQASGSGSGSDTGGTAGDTADGSDEAEAGSPPGPPEPTCVLDDSWQVLPSMMVPRRHPTALRLVDGQVLVSGGFTPAPSFDQPPVVVAKTDRFDPTTETWTTLPDLLHPRWLHGLLPLDDGDVLAVGGKDPNDEPLASVERFDLDAGVWVAAPALPMALGSTHAQVNGALRMVVGSGAPEDGAFVWVDEGWQTLTPPPIVTSTMALLPWGESMILAGIGVPRAVFYDSSADAWVQPPNDVEWHPRWLTGMTIYVQAATLMAPDVLFVLSTTGGLHPEIEAQGVAARLELGADHWVGGAPGPYWGDTAWGTARSFEPGWVLVGHDTPYAMAYDANTDAWCRTADAPGKAGGAMVVLEDGSVLFTGGTATDEGPLRWFAR